MILLLLGQSGCMWLMLFRWGWDAHETTAPSMGLGCMLLMPLDGGGLIELLLL